MPAPISSRTPDQRRTTRRRIAYVVVGLLLAAIFLGGYGFGLLQNMR